MRTLSALLIVAVLPLAMYGCGGSPGAPTPQEGTRGARITTSPAMAQLRADLAAAGKRVPEFFHADGTVPTSVSRSGEMTTQNLMSSLTLLYWSPIRSVPQDRAMWFDCYLTNGNYATDVALTRLTGDPDLFVFSPLYFDQPDDLRLIGYSVRVGSDAVGSFYPRDWGGGPGRFIAAVVGCQYSNSFRIKFW